MTGQGATGSPDAPADTDARASARWLGVGLGVLVVAGVAAYLVRASRYHGNGFVEVIAWPTLFAAGGFLLQQVLAAARHGAGNQGHATDAAADTVAGTASKARSSRMPKEAKLQPRGLVVAGCLSVAYVALLAPVGFLVDSLALITLGPIACGQPLRRLPLLVVTGAALVGVLGEVVRISGVVPLPGGFLHIGMP